MYFMVYSRADLKYRYLATNIRHVFEIIISMYSKKEME